MRENWASNIFTKIFIFLIILFTVLQMILMGSMIFAKFSKRFLLKIIINFRKKITVLIQIRYLSNKLRRLFNFRAESAKILFFARKIFTFGFSAQNFENASFEWKFVFSIFRLETSKMQSFEKKKYVFFYSARKFIVDRNVTKFRSRLKIIKESWLFIKARGRFRNFR